MASTVAVRAGAPKMTALAAGLALAGASVSALTIQRTACDDAPLPVYGAPGTNFERLVSIDCMLKETCRLTVINVSWLKRTEQGTIMIPVFRLGNRRRGTQSSTNIPFLYLSSLSVYFRTFLAIKVCYCMCYVSP